MHHLYFVCFNDCLTSRKIDIWNLQGNAQEISQLNTNASDLLNVEDELTTTATLQAEHIYAVKPGLMSS